MPNVSCVVTGYGFIGPQGYKIETLSQALKTDKSGIQPVSLFDTTPFSCHLAGQIPETVWHTFLPTSFQKRDRSLQMLFLAAEEAIEYANLKSLSSAQKSNLPVILGTTLGGMRAGTSFLEEWKNSAKPSAPFSRLRDFLPASQAHFLSQYYGFQGENLLLTNACASGANAIGYGYQLIRQQRTDLVLVGGYDPLSLFTYAGFNSLKLLSPKACTPFDQHRQGLSLGEGAGILILENESSAKKRKVPILARLLGYGESSDAFHLTQPETSGRGAIRAMKQALQEANRAPSEISYINAHGTGTFHNDLMEGHAIYQIFQKSVPVSSTKGFTGHLLGAAGTIEAIIAILTLQEQFLPKNLGLETADPQLPPVPFLRETRDVPVDYVLSNSFGFGGVNASLLFGRHL
ncbi:MAG: beta-ketoacyl-[acyl-carrier-protein] synthase family protein [Planctomycetota bacterium]